MAQFEDLTGQRFGLLTVVRRVEDHISSSGKRRTRWLCVCDCGGTKEVTATLLKTGQTRSCGCLAHSPSSYDWREYRPPRTPKPITVQNRLEVGRVYKIRGERYKLIGIYNGFARFARESGMTVCFHFFDLERWGL